MVQKTSQKKQTINKNIVLECQNLSLELGQDRTKVKILQSVDMKLKRGEKLALVGPSGSGKTSLMMLVSGLLKPTHGKIFFEQDNIAAFDEKELSHFRRRNIGIVFQNFHLMPSMNALQNVAFPLEIDGLDPNNANDRARDILKKVGLGHRLGHMPAQLSGGEQQRVALARAMVTAPKLLLADEPTGNLDGKTGDIVTQFMFDLVEQQKSSLILITHDEKLAARMDRQIHLIDGKIKR